MRCRELTEGVRSDQDRIASVNHTALDDATHHGPYKRHRKGIVDMELKRRSSVIVPVVWQDIQERSYKVEAFSGDVGNLEDGTYPLADELRGGVDGVFAVLDEDGDFARAGGFEDAR